MVDESTNGNTTYKEYMEGPPERERRICELHQSGVDEPVSRLALVSLEIRFGEISVKAEGLAGVQTLPQHRGKGHVTTLIKRALSGAAERVNVAFLYGIEDLYGKFGFTTCLRESSLSMWSGRCRETDIPNSVAIDGCPSDLSELTAIYNISHRTRPWTVVRQPEAAARITHESPWHPAPQIVTVKRDGKVSGYAAIEGKNYGHRSGDFKILEAAALDNETATGLLTELGRICRDRALSELIIFEPPDGVLGKAALAMGCSGKWEATPDGGGMAAILNRSALIGDVSKELERRSSYIHEWFGVDPDSQGMKAIATAIGKVADGQIVPRDADLIRLLLGYWSWDDVADSGVIESDSPALRSLFPGGGKPGLPLPYSHRFDRY